jgi:hypothetical protein
MGSNLHEFKKPTGDQTLPASKRLAREVRAMIDATQVAGALGDHEGEDDERPELSGPDDDDDDDDDDAALASHGARPASAASAAGGAETDEALALANANKRPAAALSSDAAKRRTAGRQMLERIAGVMETVAAPKPAAQNGNL